MASTRTLELGESERGFIYAIGRRYVREDDAADDVAQEAMLTAFRHRDAFRGDSHPRTWLYRIATNAAFDYLRRKARRRMRDAELAERALLAGESPVTPADALESGERIDQIADGLGQLDPKYADVLRLRADELGDREIAEQLGVSVGAVKVRAHRARLMLRDVLADTGADAA